jgi:hypothetical protein
VRAFLIVGLMRDRSEVAPLVKGTGDPCLAFGETPEGELGEVLAKPEEYLGTSRPLVREWRHHLRSFRPSPPVLDTDQAAHTSLCYLKIP